MTEDSSGIHEEVTNPYINAVRLQKGVLRTNCIDCLDRTNVAQYCYGLIALGRQLFSLGIVESPLIDLYNPLSEDLMKLYEMMGDTLALQYGGSAAHNKVILIKALSFCLHAVFIIELLKDISSFVSHLMNGKQIFCERRGQWKAATQSQELFRTIQRYYSNAYVDAEKQDAINVYVI